MRFLLCGLAVLALGSGCANSSEIVIGILTNLTVTSNLDEVHMDVSRNGVAVLSEDWMISAQSNVPSLLPGSFSVFSPAGGTPLIEIRIAGIKDSVEQHVRTADVELVSQDTLFYRMAVVDSCGENGPDNSTCPDGQGCVEGLCRTLTVDSKSLPRYAKDHAAQIECDSGESYISTGTCGSGTCMVIQPLARDCPSGEFCLEGTCYDRDPGSPRSLAFGETCDASQGDTCTASMDACVAPSGGDQRCRQRCTSDPDCTTELPGAVTQEVPATTASCNVASGVCTFACDVFNTVSSGCAPGSRCDVVFPTTSTVAVDCVQATFEPGELRDQTVGASCKDSRECALGLSCANNVCRALCSPSGTPACAGNTTCMALAPPQNGMQVPYGVCM